MALRLYLVVDGKYFSEDGSFVANKAKACPFPNSKAAVGLYQDFFKKGLKPFLEVEGVRHGYGT